MTLQRTRGDTIVSQTGLAIAYTYDLAMDAIDIAGLQVTYVDATGTAKTFIDANVTVAASTVTKTAHGYYTGEKIALTTSGVLPGGLSATNYYMIRVDADTLKFATSAANAAAGTAVTITSAAGGGTHTMTPAALGGVVVKLQASNDGTNFADYGTNTVTISAAGTTNWSLVDYPFRYVRINHAPSAGAVTLTVVLNAKARS